MTPVQKMNPIMVRRLAGLPYEDPEKAYASVITKVLPIFDSLRRWKSISRDEKATIERYQGALLAFVNTERSGDSATIDVAFVEADDFDVVIRATFPNGTMAYRPVQLKQVPSHAPDAQRALQDQISKLAKYGPDLSVAIWINCEGRIDLGMLSFDRLRIGQLWLFGTVGEGTTEIHGGVVADWAVGLCWHGLLTSTGRQAKPFRFKPATPPSQAPQT